MISSSLVADNKAAETQSDRQCTADRRIAAGTPHRS
jgi:hypothetical protein